MWGKEINRHFSTETYRWLRNTWKDVQHHLLLQKYKLKIQWGIGSYQSEWLSSKSLQTINAGKGMEKGEHSWTVGGNENGCSHWKVVAEPRKMPGFLACGGEEFNLGPKTRLDHSELLCNKLLLKYRRDGENFWHRHQKGAERVPPC